MVHGRGYWETIDGNIDRLQELCEEVETDPDLLV